MNRLKYLAFLLPFCVLAACARIGQSAPEADGEYRCELHLDGGVTGFAAATRAEGEFRFSDRNRLYLRMSAGERVVLGEAVYREETGTWTLTYSGSLGGATQGTAEAVLLGRTDNEVGHRVYFNYAVPVYEDRAASFTVDASGITLSADLRPKTGRISFIHDCESGSGRWFHRLAGLAFYDSFDLADFSFGIKESVRQDGFWFDRQDDVDDEYLYAFFTTPEDPYILCYDSWSVFVKHCLPEMLAPGQSGYVDHWDVDRDGWDIYWGQDCWLDGIRGSSSVDLRMRYVPAGSFLMGDASETDAGPAHPVTLSHYYIGESEVTKAMWYNVMGEPSDWANNPAPVNYRSYDEIQTFLTELNRKTGRRFRLPTEAEWEFAARGGIFTRGYEYSGSNMLDQVARRQNDYAVGTLDANELGLYDMSGDVAELCGDWYGPYPEGPVVDPAGPASGDARVVRGGYRYDGEERFTVWARARTSDYGGESCDQVGFRLVMDVPALGR